MMFDRMRVYDAGRFTDTELPDWYHEAGRLSHTERLDWHHALERVLSWTSSRSVSIAGSLEPVAFAGDILNGFTALGTPVTEVAG